MHNSFRGKLASIEVLNHLGETVRALPGKPNLMLDRGMDAVATVLLADLFLYGVVGTDDSPTTETVDVANSYSRSGSTVTRTAGTRDFTSDDVGKFLLFTGSGVTANQGGYIASLTSTTVVELNVTGGALTSKDIILFDVAQTQLVAELGLSYQNKNFTKVEGQDTIVCSDSSYWASIMAPLSGLTGKALCLYFKDPTGEGAGTTFRILATVNSTTVQVDNTVGAFTDAQAFLFWGRAVNDNGSVGRADTYGVTGGDNVTAINGAAKTFTRTFIFDPMPEVVEKIDASNTYSRAGTTITRTAGARDFTADDVGKIIYFRTSHGECKITAYTNATTVTVDTSGTVAVQNIYLFSWHTIKEVGFTDLDSFDRGILDDHPTLAGENINFRVPLAAPLVVYGETPGTPGEQIKATYEFTVTVSPSVNTVSTLQGIITDSGSSMSSKGKGGRCAIETFATSSVSSTGLTDASFAFLDPVAEGFLGISESFDALDPLGNQTRATNTQFVPFTAEAYTPGDFLKTYTGTFTMTQAVGAKWRSLMLYDPDSTSAIYTFLFDFPQTKSGERLLQMTLQKTWARDFS